MSAFVHAVLSTSPMLTPLVIALLFIVPRARRLADACVPWAPVPALLFALSAPLGAKAEIPWLLFGSSVVMDEVGRMFLLTFALVWLVVSLAARGHLRGDPRRTSFSIFLLAAMTGNLGLPLAGDVPLFYTLFALTTFSAYGIVVHRRTTAALRAARIYLVLAVLGETLLLSGVLLMAASMPTLELADVPSAIVRSPHTDLVVALLFGGFGVKAALLPLHVWLPLAHPVAPTPGSAALSGALIAAGLLGWLRFLPLELLDAPSWGTAWMVAGIVGTIYAALVGLTQRDPKTILAYSSVSQMGLMLLIVGGGALHLTPPAEAAGAASLFALHHGIAKASLFLSVAVVGPWLVGRLRGLVALGIALPVLSLAGAPLTSGAIAKKALEQATASPIFGPLAAFSSVLTFVLLLRFAWTLRLRDGPSTPPSGWVLGAWLLSVGLTLGLIWWIPWAPVPRLALQALTVPSLWAGTWPLLLGLALSTIALLVSRHTGLRAPRIPPGDLVVPVEHLWKSLRPSQSVPVGNS
jgi:hydrogenase-4 component B